MNFLIRLAAAVAVIALIFVIGPTVERMAFGVSEGVEMIPREWRGVALQLLYTSVAAVFIGSALREWLDSWGKRDLQTRSAPDSRPHAGAAAPRQRHRPLGISPRELPAPSDRSLD